MLLPVSDKMLALCNSRNFDIHDYSRNSFLFEAISYVMDSDKRRAVELSGWIRNQVKNPSLNLLNIADSILNGKDFDETVINVLRWVNNKMAWEQDSIHWRANEYWATAEETIQSNLIGDCEDGAILIYVLCRLKDIPANRLLIWTGNVQKNATAPFGGHCCLFYSPINYPYNFVNLDWCYLPDMSYVAARDFYTLKEDELIMENKGWNPYQNMWFCFSEDFSTTNYQLKRVL